MDKETKKGVNNLERTATPKEAADLPNRSEKRTAPRETAISEPRG